MVASPDTDTLVHSATIAAEGPTCPDNTVCSLTFEMPGYPALDTKHYTWAVMGFNPASGSWEWWPSGVFSPFHPLPGEALTLVTNWNGTVVNLDWPASPQATHYSAEFMNWATATSSATFECTTAACAGNANVAQIPYGTVLVRLRSCGLNGHCTPGSLRKNFGPRERQLLGPLSRCLWKSMVTAKNRQLSSQS